VKTRLVAILCSSMAALAALSVLAVRHARADTVASTCVRMGIPAQICEYQFSDGTKCVVYGLTGTSDQAQVGSSSGMQCKFQ